LTYDSTDHRWWGLREDAGTLYFETSSDGTNWLERASVLTAATFPVDSVNVVLGAGDDGNVDPGVFELDNLQGGGPPTEGWCAVSSFSDDFQAGFPGHDWLARFETDGDCTMVEQGGRLRFSHGGTAWSACGLRLPSGWDATDDAVVVEVPSIVTSETQFGVWFGLERAWGDWVEIQVHLGNIRFSYSVDNNELIGASVPYVPATHRWWRLREAAGSTYWETSPDGLAWTTHLQLADVLPMADVDVELGVWCDSPCSLPSTAEFDNYNLAP
jgi:hypothetical protein